MGQMEANNEFTGLLLPLGLYRIESDASTNDDAPTEFVSPLPAKASGDVDGAKNQTSTLTTLTGTSGTSTPTPTTPTFPTAPVTPPAASTSRLRYSLGAS